MDDLALPTTILLLGAALLGLAGTYGQAKLARARLFGDPDPLVVAAGRTWRPIGWQAATRRRRERPAAEAPIRSDIGRWRHYQELCAELRTWNALETSVALAFTAAVISVF